MKKIYTLVPIFNAFRHHFLVFVLVTLFVIYNCSKTVDFGYLQIGMHTFVRN